MSRGTTQPVATEGRRLLSGNEAVARGAWEAGVRIAAAYPGTPSTEVLESLASYPDVYAEWSPNEKVAFEVAMGGALAGARSLVAMKHVGLNVAADPLMSASYLGIRAGFVIVVSDDVGMASSQNCQDTRYYARFAKVPLLEPADSQEAKEFVADGLAISEAMDTPLIIRLTTRISHVKGIVALGPRREYPLLGFEINPAKYVILPALAQRRHPEVLERLEALSRMASESPLNRIEPGDPAIGIIAAGPAYQYAKEAWPTASFLKLGLSYPLPRDLIRRFASQVERLFVVEEIEPAMETEIRSWGIPVAGAGQMPRVGELTPRRVRAAIRAALGEGTTPGAMTAPPEGVELFPRPPTLCAGCPHAGVFTVLAKMKDVIITGDIGCYTLGANAPWRALHTCVCMGASLGNALGIQKALAAGGGGKRVVAVIGDSTFLHSGIPGLVDIVYNKGKVTVIILDNRTVGMTGGQDHPGTGVTLQEEKTRPVDFVELCRAVGVEWVRRVDPYVNAEVRQALKEALAHPGPSVLVTNRPCVLIDEFERERTFQVLDEECSGCAACLKVGCPAISVTRREVETLKNGRQRSLAYVTIDSAACNGCNLCVQTCGYDAIAPTPDAYVP